MNYLYKYNHLKANNNIYNIKNEKYFFIFYEDFISVFW